MAKQKVEIELLKTGAAYHRAVHKLAKYFDQPPVRHSAEKTEFEILMLMVEKYKEEHFPIPTPDPIAAIRFEVEQRGMSAAELGIMLGSRQRAHEVLRRKRPLTLSQIRILCRDLDIPADVLIQEYDLVAA